MKTACSDWHRGWGIGYNTIGTLHTTEVDDQYLWKGRNQGRHGQIWNRGTSILFKVSQDGESFDIIERKGKGFLPFRDDVKRSIQTLKTMASELEKKQQRKAKKSIENQLKLEIL